MTQFKDLGLAGALLRAIENEGYTQPTPIQAQAIPYLMQNRDLLGIAQTGTGKTAAFALPILHKLVSDRQRPVSRRTRVLVMAPTRELVSQIADSFRSYGRHAHMQIATVFGGVSYGPQVKALGRGLDVLVATPGRLLDHLQQGTLRLDGTEIVVLDEADHMLDLGFIVPIREIVAKLPSDRQTLFFSATMPKEISKLAGEMLNNPAQVTVKPEGTTAERVDQSVYMVDQGAKNTLLVHLLKQAEFERTLIFTRTKRGADRVAKLLCNENVSSQAIHGNKSQAQREKALAAFKRGSTQVLVATDIAARGIDVDNVTHVVNYELPDVPEAYVHRIGRTARAGAAGKAIAFCDSSERGSLRDIQRLTRMSIPAFVWSADKGTTQIDISNDNIPADDRGSRRRSGGRPQRGSSRPSNGPKRQSRGFERKREQSNTDTQVAGRSRPGARKGPRADVAAGARPARQDARRHDADRQAVGRQDAAQTGERTDHRGFKKAAPRNAKAWGDGRSNDSRPAERTNNGQKSHKKPHRKGQAGAARPEGIIVPDKMSADAARNARFNKPNRPGQRRRRKIQAERAAQEAVV